MASCRHRNVRLVDVVWDRELDEDRRYRDTGTFPLQGFVLWFLYKDGNVSGNSDSFRPGASPWFVAHATHEATPPTSDD